MEEKGLDIKSMLDAILKTTKKNANILADRYLLKDVSIISKWKNNKVVPKNDDISQIVDFAVSESTEVQRRMMRDKIELLVYNSRLRENIKETILNIEAFDEFLAEALNASTVGYGSGDREVEGYSNEKDNTAGGPDQRVDGEYSGVVRFDLVLSKKGKNRHKGEGVEGRVSFAAKSGMGRLQKYILRGKTVLTIVVLAVAVWGILMAWAGSGSQNTNSQRIVQAGPVPTSTSAPVQEPVATVPASTPAVTRVDTTAVPAAKPPAKPKGAVTQNNGGQNQMNNSGDGNITSYSADVDGDGSIAAAGSNIAISVEK